MASKYYVFGCLTCGEYFRCPLEDSVKIIEMHMCDGEKLGEKREKLLKLREMIDNEIDLIPSIPKPPKLPSPTRPSPPVPPRMPPPVPPKMPPPISQAPKLPGKQPK